MSHEPDALQKPLVQPSLSMQVVLQNPFVLQLPLKVGNVPQSEAEPHLAHTLLLQKPLAQVLAVEQDKSQTPP